jgi:methylated-DNA-[protein]-cysteine S-methyltransferase
MHGAIQYRTIRTRWGRLLIQADANAVKAVSFEGGRHYRAPAPRWQHGGSVADQAVAELRAYLSGERKTFSVLTAPEGTPFQQRVWRTLRRIPYGETLSYGEVARRIRQPGAARAVGAAARDNPVAIIIPCHRVVGSDGRLTGYAGGLDRKAGLLALELRHAPRT